jgi:hypothetical protein
MPTHLQHWSLRAIWLLHVSSQAECPYAAVVVLQERAQQPAASQAYGIAAQIQLLQAAVGCQGLNKCLRWRWRQQQLAGQGVLGKMPVARHIVEAAQLLHACAQSSVF